MRVLILGAGGFVGNSLVQAILERTEWSVSGMDLSAAKLEHSLSHARFHFELGNIAERHDWVDEQVAQADVVLPLAAIATPASYVRRPLDVFELTFEENLRIVRSCVASGARLVFPSSSEVYGMCSDELFDEESSPMVQGPTASQRWIYASSKQLLDRVIFAYGRAGRLDFTLVRPFNWIGPQLDDPQAARDGSCRVVTQFIDDLLTERPLELVDGGEQKRCFTHIDDGIDCLMQVLENRDGLCSGEILNIGNPDNECTIRELASMLRDLVAEHAEFDGAARRCRMIDVAAHEHYGVGYEDLTARRPNIDKARRLLGWQPKIGLEAALRRTVEAYVVNLSSIAVG